MIISLKISFYWKGKIYREERQKERSSIYWVTPQIASITRAKLTRSQELLEVSHMCAGSQILVPSSVAFPGPKQGAGSEVRKPGHPAKQVKNLLHNHAVPNCILYQTTWIQILVAFLIPAHSSTAQVSGWNMWEIQLSSPAFSWPSPGHYESCTPKGSDESALSNKMENKLKYLNAVGQCRGSTS